MTKRLKPHLADYEVRTVSEMNWNGIKNGRLITLCIENHFDLLLTIDKNLLHQQNLANLNITIAALNTVTSKIEESVLFMPSFKAQVSNFEKGKAYPIEK